MSLEINETILTVLIIATGICIVTKQIINLIKTLKRPSYYEPDRS